MSYEDLSLYSNRLSRRTVLRGAGLGLGGAAGALLVGCGDDGPRKVDLADESLPPETTRLVLPVNDGTICVSPMYMAHPFLVAEGFTDIEYRVTPPEELIPGVAKGMLDINLDFAAALAQQVDQGLKLTFLAGMHGGCYELFAREGINSVRELTRKKVAVMFGEDVGLPGYAFMAAILAFVGVPPDRLLDSYNFDDVPGLLKRGEIDAVITIPPQGDVLRDAGAGHVILDSSTDRPWSDYYCCFLFANSGYVRKNPIATKRIVRSILKGADVCAREPERAARYLVENGHTADYDQTLRTLHHLHYDYWRTHSSEDTLRFYALGLKGVGEIKSTPDQILKHADFRFLNQIKRDMAYAPGFPRQRGAFALDCDVDPAADVAGPRQA